MRVALTINGNDAYAAYGITLDETSLGALMAPPPMKDRIQSKSRLEHGKRVVIDDMAKMDSRELTLQLNITARTEQDFLAKYAAFCQELKTGVLVITTISGTYNCLYKSCQQFSQFQRGIGKFVLRLEEFNPGNRV